jgi:hypothetical protein
MAEQLDLTPLSAATVQQIQFELFRPSAPSVKDGEVGLLPGLRPARLLPREDSHGQDRSPQP